MPFKNFPWCSDSSNIDTHRCISKSQLCCKAEQNCHVCGPLPSYTYPTPPIRGLRHRIDQGKSHCNLPHRTSQNTYYIRIEELAESRNRTSVRKHQSKILKVGGESKCVIESEVRNGSTPLEVSNDVTWLLEKILTSIVSTIPSNQRCPISSVD